MRRRGLSTVIGAVFMIIVMIGALNVTLWMLQQQDRVATAVMEKTSGNLDRLNERIEISDIRIDGSKLNMTVTNSGGQPAKLKSLYVIDETAVPKQQFRYDLDIPVDGRNSAKNVGQDVSFTASSTSLYSVRVITEAGNAASSVVTPVSAVALPMSLYVIPPTVTPGENVTLLYTVTNNSTDAYLAAGITPALSYSLPCTPGPGCQLTQHVAPPSNISVSKGATGLFKWVFKVDAPDQTPVTFNATINNAKQGNYVIERGRVEVVDLAQQSSYSEIIISSDLVQKPEIFLIIPSPFGDNSQRGLWGITVVNPTDVPMEVSRIVINIFTTHLGGSQQIMKVNCPVTELSPTTGWTCIHDNQLEWKNTASPEVVSSLSAKSFLARVQPEKLTSGDEPAFTISVTVFTSMGQFAKSGYSGGMSYTDAPVTNVYLTDTTDPEIALQNSHMLGYKSGITGSSPVTLNIAVADLDNSNTMYVKSGTKLVINVPKGFTDVALASYNGFTDPPTVTPYSDGSHQIVATLAEDLGDTSGQEAKVLSFTATAPVVPDKRIFIMHCLLNGKTDSNFSVGGFAQIALQILP